MFGFPAQVIAFTVVGCGLWLMVLVWAYRQRYESNQWHHCIALIIATGFWWLGEALAIRLGKYEYAPFPSWITLPGGSASAAQPDFLYKAVALLMKSTSGTVLGSSTCLNKWFVPFPIVALEAALVFTILRLSVLRFKGRGWRPAVATAGFSGLLIINLTMVADPVVSKTAECAPMPNPHTVLDFGLWRWITLPEFPGYWFGVPLINYAAWLTACFVFGLYMRWHDERAGGVDRRERTLLSFVAVVIVSIIAMIGLLLAIYTPLGRVLQGGEARQFSGLIALIVLASAGIFLGRRHHDPELKLFFWAPQLVVLAFCLFLLLLEPNGKIFGLWTLSTAILAVVMAWPYLVKAADRPKRADVQDVGIRG